MSLPPIGYAKKSACLRFRDPGHADGSAVCLLAIVSNMGNDRAMPTIPGGLGEYLKDQRNTAQLSIRQLAAAAGVSNPYLSQIERGLHEPSVRVLRSIARVRVSSASLGNRGRRKFAISNMCKAIFFSCDSIIAR